MLVWKNASVSLLFLISSGDARDIKCLYVHHTNVMIRIIQIPLSREKVFRVLTDPIELLVWLDALSVTTGAEVFHVFEVIHNRSQIPWRIRGAFTECIPPETLVVETDFDRKHGKAALHLNLRKEETGCSLSVEWSNPILDSLAAALLDPVGITRLVRSLQSPALGPS